MSSMRAVDIHTLPGPVLLLAGPGTGKTYQLAKRLKYLITEQKVPPESITVITFTGAAAQNMRDRISDDTKPELYIPYLEQPKLICTMHSLGFRIIKECSNELGLKKDLRVVHDDHLRSVLVADAAQLAGYTRESARETTICRQTGGCTYSDCTKCKICKKYKELMLACSAVDYDEQILLACEVLKNKPTLLAKYRESAQHLLADEYQDINAAQYELIRILSDTGKAGLFLVGDDDQSIYSWRGGSPDHIRNFERDFGEGSTVIPLLHSYRCHRHILEGSLGVVKQYDSDRLEKGEFSYKREDGPKIAIHNTPSDEREAKEVRRVIERSLPSQDVLVLFPSRQFALAIIKELISRRIPFTTQVSQPGTGFPLLSSLSDWFTNPADSLSLRRCLDAIVGNPSIGIPSEKARKAEKKKEREDSLRLISELWQPVLKGKAGSLWESVKQHSKGGGLLVTVFQALSELLVHSEDEKDLSAFLAGITRYLAPWKKVTELLGEVTSWIEALNQANAASSNSSVRLMTYQAAKGLEAKVVCVIGLEDGIMPRQGEEVDLAEQSRLFFVSMTRAVNELHLFHARKRAGSVVLKSIFPEKGGPPQISRSSFLDAIPSEHIDDYYHPAGT